MNEICKPYDAKMQKTIEVVKSDFASVRAGRANAAVLDQNLELKAVLFHGEIVHGV